MTKFADPKLPCHGCGHSAAGAEFPGHPSGERPCGFCVRNPGLGEGEIAEWFGERGPLWYDGETPPYKTPMDCYISTDRSQQNRVFDALDAIKAGKQTVEPRGDGYGFMRKCGMTDDEIKRNIEERGAHPCCEGGPVEGHRYTCISVIGLSFG